MNCDKFRPLLDPFRDGELQASEHSTLADHVATCRSCAATLATGDSLSRHLKDAGPMPAPADLQARVLAALDQEDLRSASSRPRAPLIASGWSQAAAVAFISAISALGGWQLARFDQQPDATAQSGPIGATQVLQAHIRALVQDNPLQVASSDSHTVRPWFAGRIDVAPNVQDFASQGFPLIGGRLDLIGDQRAGVVVYKRKAHWINVYMWPSRGTPDTAPVAITRNGYNLITWTRGGITSWAVSDLNTTELRQLQSLL